VLTGHTEPVNSVTLEQLGGHKVLVSGSKMVPVLEFARKRFLRWGKAVLRGHVSWAHSVALGWFSGHNVVVSGSSDSTVRVWELESDNIRIPIFMEASVLSIALNGPDIVVGSSAGIAVLGFE
jgi:WD40 repeat protein